VDRHDVEKLMTPRGVEHALAAMVEGRLSLVEKLMTPRGVEHRWGASGDDADKPMAR
jgi:hypothetical protein